MNSFRVMFSAEWRGSEKEIKLVICRTTVLGPTPYAPALALQAASKERSRLIRQTRVSPWPLFVSFPFVSSRISLRTGFELATSPSREFDSVFRPFVASLLASPAGL